MSTGVSSVSAHRNGAANEDNLDEIKESLNRIEGVLNRGQHLLYGDEGEDSEAVDVSAVASVPAHQSNGRAYNSYHTTPPKRSTVNAVSPDFQWPPATHTSAPPRNGTAQAESASKSLRYHQAIHDSSCTRISGSATRARSTLTRNSGALRLSKAKKGEEVLSVSARARRIQAIKEEGGRMPNFEEGVNDDDTAQNISIAELKARIHRELEEYHRNGPLMHRHASYQRKQRASTAPRSSEALRSSAVKAAGVGKTPCRTVKTSNVKTPQCMARLPTSTLQQQRTAPIRGVDSTPAGRATTKSVGPSASVKPRPRTVVPLPSRPTPAATVAPENSGAAKPFWERLYRDAAAQQEKRDQLAEQRRIELEAERAKLLPRRRVHRPQLHSTYTAYHRVLQTHPESTSGPRKLEPSLAAASGSIPPQHVSYLPKRTTATLVNTAAAKPPTSDTAARNSAPHGALGHLAARQPSAQQETRKRADAWTPQVPIALAPGSRVATENDVQRNRAAAVEAPKLEAERAPPPVPGELAAPLSECKHDTNRERLADGVGTHEHPGNIGANRADEMDVKHSDPHSDSDDGLKKTPPHPYVAPLDLSNIKK
ncbi:hypothetical protein ABL78_2475 [Leptomonas seymouri]|uniref:Uncharacterized protein n=1 Tax=Leptomonas seymouri TaxID=5684 RepID=A0A0N1HZ65_LEPSE|nr:hypothetical protein ABL78_2475 [Leptomonas seymouri]|eukprot:KPI88410.1 hypothetical protein ABL78_2475 [Leptomonas seymouri]